MTEGMYAMSKRRKKMHIQSLNKNWILSPCEGECWEIFTDVPCSVLHAMVKAQQIDDPFYRQNEYEARELFTKDYRYRMTFVPEEEVLSQEQIELVCYGLDTLAEIRLNGKEIARTNNMHRTWRFPVKGLLNSVENHLEILFRSSLNMIREKGKEPYISYVPKGGMAGESYIRKGHWMFGWDWGPQLPDAGIWRPVELRAFSEGRLADVSVHQEFQSDTVSVEICTEIEALHAETFGIRCILTDPDGNSTVLEGDRKVTFAVENPRLWWPNTYGAQPLYGVKTELLNEAGDILDVWQKRIGLRRLTISREKDQWGEEFCFKINGLKIFAMGADYVPEDSLITRITPDRTRRLLQDCVAANFNSIRVWGGGYYPDDYFFDLCDELGLIVWQDAMFACNIYHMTHPFEANIRAELKDNFIRIRHHASLGLICGNNEMEFAWVDWPEVMEHHPALKADYIKQFEYVLPEMAETFAPDVFFWTSSPSSGGCFDDPNAENRGDVHYWDVWHGMKPFTDYEKFYFRFCSEFGFESFPGEKTVCAFTEEQDRNIFSPVMESHQKNGSANGLIMYYISSYYRYPKDFGSLLYISQLLQAEAMRHGVEHWRRNRGRCMGAFYWQLNDCWPVASWASIDYFGRWKALHYYAKRFFAPVTVTAKYDSGKLKVWVHNDSRAQVRGTLEIEIRDMRFGLIKKTSLSAEAEPLCVRAPQVISVMDIIDPPAQEQCFAVVRLKSESGEALAMRTILFALPKQVDLPVPEYQLQVTEQETQFSILVKSSCFAFQTELVSEAVDAPFSDNFFDITDPGGVTVTVSKDRLTADITREKLLHSLKVRSVADSY